MEATFFVARPEDVVGVTSSDDLPVEPAAESFRPCSPAALKSLAHVLGVDGKRVVTPLTDQTCRSFPIWVLGREVAIAIGQLDESGIDAVAERWRDDECMDADELDLYELTTLLGDLQQALRETSELSARVCVLLEQKAF